MPLTLMFSQVNIYCFRVAFSNLTLTEIQNFLRSHVNRVLMKSIFRSPSLDLSGNLGQCGLTPLLVLFSHLPFIIVLLPYHKRTESLTFIKNLTMNIAQGVKTYWRSNKGELEYAFFHLDDILRARCHLEVDLSIPPSSSLPLPLFFYPRPIHSSSS